MPNRMISLERNTNETQIELTLDLDGTGRYEIDTGCGFLNHMLELFARHGRFDLVLTCHGDVQVDYHHTTEDVGIALGQAFARALGEMRGICRYGSFHLPMDAAQERSAVALSGRARVRACRCGGCRQWSPPTPMPSAPPTGLSCRGWAHSGMPWQSLPPPTLCRC